MMTTKAFSQIGASRRKSSETESNERIISRYQSTLLTTRDKQNNFLSNFSLSPSCSFEPEGREEHQIIASKTQSQRNCLKHSERKLFKCRLRNASTIYQDFYVGRDYRYVSLRDLFAVVFCNR